jgi:DNA repair protein RadC
MRKRKGNSIAEAGVWNAYEYQMKRTLIDKKTLSLRVESPRELANVFREFADAELSESLFVVSFGGRNNVLGIQRLYQGTATGTSVSVGEILRSALLMGAVGFALVHNHPSGDEAASEEDVKLTQDVESAARLMDMIFLDHLVVGFGGSYTSIRSQKPDIFLRPN